jgi:two-component system sensor histidine kinase MprB
VTLRLRLTLLYMVIATVSIGGLGIGAYLVVKDTTLDSVDRSLEADARAIEASFEHLGGPIGPDDVDASRLSLDRQAVRGVVFQIRDAEGAVLYSSAGGAELPDASPDGTLVTGGTGSTVDDRTRALIEPVVRYGAAIGSIEVRAPLGQADATVEAVRNALLGGGALAALLSGAVAYAVAGHAASPVVALSALAREIERTADFTRRLPDQSSSREMKEMAVTFNRMIRRVDEMIQSQRHFLSDTSHELRRPLTILRTDIEVLNEPGLTPEDLATVQEEMRTAAANMSSLLTELLILARQNEDRPELEPVELTELCRSICRRIAREHPRLTYELHLPRLVWVHGDRLRLERMVANVLHNAATYTEAPGVIAFSVMVQDHRVSIVVRDTGSGIAPADLDHIFDRFYRGSEGRRLRPEGTGLGLPIVQQVADSHGGSVSVVSTPGHGTTVTIDLPVIPDPARLPALLAN